MKNDFRIIEQQLDFTPLREYLERNVLTDSGRDYIREMVFSTNPTQLKIELMKTKEMLEVFRSGEVFPRIEFDNILALIQYVEVSGAVLDAQEVREIGRCLAIFFSCKAFFFGRKKAMYPKLSTLFLDIQVDETLNQMIIRTVDDDGEVLDTADPQLGEIRRRLNKARQQIRSKIQHILGQSIKDGYSEKDVLPTIINGRMVIPVKAESKRIMPGLVHDESSSGATVYFEPSGMVDANNEVKELILQEKRIIYKVLSDVSKKIAENSGSITALYKRLGELDAIKSKAKLAQVLDADLPQLAEKPSLKLKEARNPNLVLKSVGTIPLDIELDKDNTRFVVISGPNAGGKSVALKTVGLFVYMLQCGLLLPLHKDSELGFFKDIFVDIGDQQSVEDELSTYSAHLKNLYLMLGKANKDTLILIDELGGGTAPEYGGAIAEVMLTSLLDSQCLGLVTTHFSNLKSLAEEVSGVENACMLYDFEKLKPLYVLELGKPGHSYAIELVKKTGFSDEIVEKINIRVDRKIRDFDEITKKLEKEYVSYLQKHEEAEAKNKRADQLIQEYRELKQNLENKKNDFVRKGKQEAKELVKTANQKIEKAIYEIKKSQADKEKTKEVRKEIDSFKEKITEKPSRNRREVVTVDNTKIEVGDKVKVSTTGAKGELLKLRGNRADVQVGSFIMSVKADELVKIEQGRAKRVKPTAKTTYSSIASTASFSQDLDIRGKRADEAIQEVERYIDNCIITNVDTVRIIHGKGNGILRDIVRNLLRDFSQVTHYEDEHIDFGGTGVTVVSF